jgi:hypothetical protein
MRWLYRAMGIIIAATIFPCLLILAWALAAVVQAIKKSKDPTLEALDKILDKEKKDGDSD